jgi:hypothetical protein
MQTFQISFIIKSGNYVNPPHVNKLLICETDDQIEQLENQL